MTSPTLRFINANGRDVTATDVVAGYAFRDYFPGVDLENATADDLADAYLGPDVDGIGVEWDAA
jgi:hypothetical protein